MRAKESGDKILSSGPLESNLSKWSCEKGRDRGQLVALTCKSIVASTRFEVS